MTAVIRQARANLRGHRLQTWLVFLTLLAAATLLTLALSTFRTAQGAYDRLFERSHGAHLWLELNPALTSAETVESVLTSLPGVQETTSPRTYLFARLLAGEAPEEVRLGEWPGESVTVGRPLLMAGRVPQPGEADAIALDRNFAVESNLSVGDAIKLLTPTGWRPMTVSGLFVTDRFPPYPSYGPALAYVASGAREELGMVPSGSLETVELVAGLRLQPPPDPRAVRQAAVAALPSGSVVSSYDWLDTRRICESNILPRRILLLTFSLVAGLAAGFLIANAVGGAVRAQTRQIGLLKAVGFTRRQLTAVYLSEYLALALAASLIGLLAGGMLSPLILHSLTAQFGETLAFPPFWAIVVTPLSTLLVAALFTLLPVHRAVRLNAVEAIRVGADRPRRRSILVRPGTRLGLSSLPLALAMGWSNLLSQPGRAALTALGLGLAVFALIAAFALTATVQAVISDPAMGYLQDADLVLFRPRYFSEAEVGRLIADQPDIVAAYTQRWWNFRLSGEEEPLYAIFRGGDLTAFRFPIVEGRMFEAPDEAVVGYGLADEYDLHPGDLLTILLAGESLTFRVVGTYRTTDQEGRMLTLPLKALRQVRPDAETFVWRLKLRPGAEARTVATALIESSGGLLEVEIGGEGSLPAWIRSLESVTAVLALVLGGIAAVGVLNSVWLTLQERQREFGMLKAVGMTPRQVTLSVMIGAVVMALVGYLVGLPLGVAGISLLMDSVARAIGFGPLTPPLNGAVLALLLPVIMLIALVGAYIPARQAGQVSVVEMLRCE